MNRIDMVDIGEESDDEIIRQIANENKQLLDGSS